MSPSKTRSREAILAALTAEEKAQIFADFGPGSGKPTAERAQGLAHGLGITVWIRADGRISFRRPLQGAGIEVRPRAKLEPPPTEG